MTWSVVYTKADPNNFNGGNTAEHVQFYQYFFDTFLPTKAGWTVAAHPSGNSWKRKMTYEVTNILSGNQELLYSWADWNSSTASSYMYWYEDATYTTVKHDLCTTGQSIAIIYNSNTYYGAGRTFRIWESSDNARGWMVTRGAELVMWWPGMTSACIYGNDALWTAGQHNPRTAYVPYGHGNNYMTAFNAPIHTGSTSSEMYMFPTCMVATGSDGKGRLFNHFDMMLSYSSGSFDSYSTKAFSVTQDDVLWYVPGINSTSRNYTNYRNLAKAVVKIGNNYYISTSPNMGQPNLMFDLGTSSPGIL